MAEGYIATRYPVIRIYEGEATTNGSGNIVLSEPVNVATGAILSVNINTADSQNYRGIIFGSSGSYVLRIFDYSSTNMNSASNVTVKYQLTYFLY